ncbi:hypothetical protein EP7_001733 [Isosphaeraceae bacterium EP7]
MARQIMCAIVAASVLFMVGVAFHLAMPLVAPGIPPQFSDSSLYRPWTGWTSTYMLVHPLWFGVVFAAMYQALRTRGMRIRGWRGGLCYGLGVFLVGSLPVFLLAFASFRVSGGVIFSWVAQSLCQYAAAGAAVGAAAGQD